MAALAQKTATAAPVNTAPPLPAPPVVPVTVGKSAVSTVPTPAATKAATPPTAPKPEAVSIVTGKPVADTNGAQPKLDAKAATMTPATNAPAAVKPWYADQSKLIKIALVSIVLYFLYQKFVK